MITLGLACSAASCLLFAYCASRIPADGGGRLSPGQRWYPPAFVVMGVLGLIGSAWAAVRVNW